MPGLSTTSVSLAVTPTVVSTLFSHYLNRKPLKERPTAHLSYDEGLHLIRSFLDFASQHTVEELQAFTAQWVPAPRWVKVDTVTIPELHLDRAAEVLQNELGQDGIRLVGGRDWWQWRRPKARMECEWIEMKSDAKERTRKKHPGRRVMLYVHGGAYFFGSVDEHRYQMQRHARKLKARVFAPKYRLAPQFPFPCGLQDCLASYLYLLTVQEPSTIVLAGDSAGGGMVMALLCLLRDQDIPLPAGAILVSPWVDLTHSFPSVAGDAPFDYIPTCGFHHKPSRSWPPPNEDDGVMLEEEARKTKSKTDRAAGRHELEEKQQFSVAPTDDEPNSGSSKPKAVSGGIVSNPNKFLSVTIDGTEVIVKDQIQMYATNELLAHPLVSPVMQPTLGGLPPLLIMVGGGEILRDEQVYLAHKCANPAKYAPPDKALTPRGRRLLEKYKATDVQLQVWDDLCHVAPTLSFTRPAKYMYRSISQFGAWALARAQNRGIEIMDDDAISIISTSESGTEEVNDDEDDEQKRGRPALTHPPEQDLTPGQVGKAGDTLPPFTNHMIRQRVTRHGVTLPLAAEGNLPGCCMDPAQVGQIKEGTVKKWLAAKKQWDDRFASAKAKVHKKIINDMAVGYHPCSPGDNPPPTALAGRIRVDADLKEKRKKKGVGLAMWSLWGSKHDEAVVAREGEASAQPEAEIDPPAQRAMDPSQNVINPQPPPDLGADSRSRSRRKTVVDEHQTEIADIDENTSVAKLMEIRKKKESDAEGSGYLSPMIGVAGKRPFIDGIAMPFSLNKEADTASMVTLHSSAPTPGLVQKNFEGLADDLSQQATDGGQPKEGQPVLDSVVTPEAEDATQATTGHAEANGGPKPPAA